MTIFQLFCRIFTAYAQKRLMSLNRMTVSELRSGGGSHGAIILSVASRASKTHFCIPSCDVLEVQKQKIYN